MRSRFRTILTAAAATGLVAVALIGCQPEASPTDSVDTESFPAESMAESMHERGAERLAERLTAGHSSAAAARRGGGPPPAGSRPI
jgi:hypothetical protein